MAELGQMELVMEARELASIPLSRNRTPARKAYMKAWTDRNRVRINARKLITNKAWRESNREKVRARMRIYRQNNREKFKVWKKRSDKKAIAKDPKHHIRKTLRQKYGITVEQCDALFAQNNGLCHICSKSPSEATDHNHETGVIRGALCHRCNWMIGHAKEDESTLLRAIQYLRKHKIQPIMKDFSNG